MAIMATVLGLVMLGLTLGIALAFAEPVRDWLKANITMPIFGRVTEGVSGITGAVGIGASGAPLGQTTADSFA